MEAIKCYVPNCSLNATEICETCKKANCLQHSHAKTHPNHEIYPIFIEVSDSYKNPVIRSLNSTVCKCQKIRSDAQKNCKSLIQIILNETDSLVNTLNSIELQALALIVQLSSCSKVQTYQNKNPNEQLLVEFVKSGGTNCLDDKLEHCKPDLKGIILKDYIENFINCSPLQHSISFMAFSSRNSNVVNFYHLKDNAFKTLKLNENIGDRAGWCYLPDGRIFHYGGRRKDENIGTTLIINPGAKTAEFKSRGQKMRNVGQLAYYKGEIYVFGGFDVTPLALVQRYTLMKDTWTNLNPMPVASESCSSSCYGNSILLTGQNLISLYEYDRANDNFKVLIDLPSDYKIVWAANGKFFCLCQNLIYESDLYNKDSWSFYFESSVKVEIGRLLAPTAKRGELIFILFENQKLYTFNFATKKIAFITTIPKFT